MLSAFFLAQLFQEISEETLSSELLIVNMLEELLWNCSAREGSNKSQTSRGLDEDIRSRFVTDNKSSVLIDRSIRTFAPNTTSAPSKSPISSRTRSKADARDIKSKGVYSYGTFNNTDIKKEEEEEDE